MASITSAAAQNPVRKRVTLLWLVRVLLVLAGLVCIPIVLIAQELLAALWPATADWGMLIAGAMGLVVLGVIGSLMEAAKARLAPDDPFDMFHGRLFPLGFMVGNPKGTASSDFAVVEHAFGVDDGAFILGFRSRGTGGQPVGTIAVEDRIAFDRLRHIAVKVNSDESIQNHAAGGAAFDGVANALSRHKIESKAVGALLVLLVEGEAGKIAQYTFAIPADVSAATIRALSTAVADAASTSAGEGAVAGVLDAVEICQTVIDVLQSGDLAEALPSGDVGLGDVAGFLGRLSQASQLTGANARLAAALLATVLRQHAPHAPVTRVDGG